MVPYLHVGNNISKVRKTQTHTHTLDGLDVSIGGVDIPLFLKKTLLILLLKAYWFFELVTVKRINASLF